MRENIFFITLLLVCSSSLLANEKSTYFPIHNECENNKKFLTSDYNIQCNVNYHHYNSSAARNNYSSAYARSHGEVKIAEFNVLHPGMSKSRFKDYKKVAQIINQFDVVGVTELIPLMSDDARTNDAILKFIHEAPDLISETKQKIRKLERSQSDSVQIKRGLRLNKLKLEQLERDLSNVSKIYRFPGYVKILNELHKLSNGDEWALILTPSALGAATSPTPELVGYYYRSSVVKPEKNAYCEDTKLSGGRRLIGAACIPLMNSQDMGKNYNHLFSRKPFLGQFRSGSFNFTLLTSHVIFDSPDDMRTQRRILRDAFSASSTSQLGVGINQENYARFAEVKITLKFINDVLINRYGMSNIIFMGDLNLEYENQYWQTILNTWRGSSLFISQKTSLTRSRFDYRTGDETNGLSSSYDHFIFDPRDANECMRSRRYANAGVLNFLSNSIGRMIENEVKVRKDEKDYYGQYKKDKYKYQRNYKKFVSPYLDLTKKFYTISQRKSVYDGKYKISSEGIVINKTETQEHGKLYLDRVMNSQFYDRRFYSYFAETISDHLPIFLKCAND